MNEFPYGGECARGCGVTPAARSKTDEHPAAMNSKGPRHDRQARRPAAGFNQPPQLSPKQVNQLLYELCVELGFCSSPSKQARLLESRPMGIEAFMGAVIRTEGLDPHSGMPRHLRRKVRTRVAEHFRKAEDEQQTGQRV